MDLTLQNRIRTGEIDVNNTEMFLSAALKALIFKLNKEIFIRNKAVPHFMMNTGDDIMYLEVKGQDHSMEPTDISNENFVYNQVPRCLVDMTGVEALDDQLTSPYTRGHFELEMEDGLHGFNAEFRRIPLRLSVSLRYTLDNFTDTLALSQYIITHCFFIQTYRFSYLGHTMQASYKVPSSFDHDKMLEFDGYTTDSKNRTMSLDLEVETNIPVFDLGTAIENSNFIRTMVSVIHTPVGDTTIHTSAHDEYIFNHVYRELEVVAEEALKAVHILNPMLNTEKHDMWERVDDAAKECQLLHDDIYAALCHIQGRKEMIEQGAQLVHVEKTVRTGGTGRNDNNVPVEADYWAELLAKMNAIAEESVVAKGLLNEIIIAEHHDIQDTTLKASVMVIHIHEVVYEILEKLQGKKVII